MYRTLIVDDEQLMRQYLNKNLSKICSDFCVTGIACDGLEAVELIKKQTFDLVITDIRMPEMDGLNLAKYVFETSADTKVIIISGYNEFEYARLALKYGVSDYLLKPLNDANISETLIKAKNELDLETSRKNSILSTNSYDNYSDNEIKSALLSAIIKNNSGSIHLFYNILQSRKITFISSYSAIMLLCIDDLNLLLQEKKISENTSYKFELNQKCQIFCKLKNYATTYDDHGYTIILPSVNSEEDLVATANAIYDEILHTYWSNEKIKLTASYGIAINDLMSITASYSAAVEALTLTLKNVPSPITSKYYISQSSFINELNVISEALYSDYISKNSNKMLSDLYLYITLFQNDINVAAILKFGTYLIRYLAKKCNIKTDYVISAFKELTSNIDQVINTKKLEKESIHSIFLKVLKALDNENTFTIVPETTKIVESAKEYICTHYQEQVSLAIMADYLNVNPSYLSDLFHKSIGEPYIKFLTRIRMEQALLLLKSNPNEKIYKIAEKTGFVSSKHFNTVFKKFYGMTPTEYINRNMFNGYL
ncbi:MAG: response regulator [Anaerocolumna sp.]